MIIVDSRETRSKVPAMLKVIDAEYRIETLDIGDYLIGDICIERKSAGDYIGSLQSKHLNNQLVKMSIAYPWSICIIEGIVDLALVERSMTENQYYSSVAGTILKRSPDGESGRISIFQTSTAYGTAIFLKAVDRKIEKPLIRLPKIETVKMKPEDRALGVLCQFPLIGEETARLILSNYKNLYMALKNYPNWKDLPNIGNKKVLQVHKVMKSKL